MLKMEESSTTSLRTVVGLLGLLTRSPPGRGVFLMVVVASRSSMYVSMSMVVVVISFRRLPEKYSLKLDANLL